MRRKYFLGIDVGGTFTKVALVSENGRLLVKQQIPSKNFADKSFFARQMKRIFSSLTRNGRNFSTLLVDGIVISNCGTIFSRFGSGILWNI